MPINTKYPLADVIAAAPVFDRRVTFEYVMLGGVNDAPEHARELAQLARECRAFVNLIPLHPGGAGRLHADDRARTSAVSRASCGATAWRSRSERAAAWTSPRHAGSYGWNGCAGGRHVAAEQHGDVQVA